MTRTGRHPRRSITRPALLVGTIAAALAVGACQRDEAPAAEGAAGATPAAGGMEGMPGMPGMDHGSMQGGMQGGDMMARMQAHMGTMDGASADSLRAMLPMHRQMVANMIAQFNREMRDMGMATDAAWSATVDSLRQDLVRMPELSGGELRSLMPAHRSRVMRLMEMHGSMMRNMPR